MGANMNLDYEAMRGVGSKILGEQGNLSDFVQRMNSNIRELRGVWDSTAAQEFENTWNMVEPQLRRLHEELIPNISMQIRTAADNYQAADDAAAAAARGV